jgi:phage antirepressor YoqD-like protein
MIHQVRKSMLDLVVRNHILMDDLKSMKIGRDKLFDILRANHLLIQPKRSYHVTTNLIIDLENIKT